MSMENTDVEWEKFGAQNPYYGVLTDDKFKSSNLNDLALAEFFESGEAYVEELLTTIRRLYQHSQNPKKILDFGCGVGRLVIPFSKRSEFVVGIDVSESMLKEAAKNCAGRSITNVRFMRSADDLNGVAEQFDFVHSYIVFQHIPVLYGEKIVQRLLDLLARGGIGALHFTYARIGDQPRLRIPGFIKRVVPYYDIIRKLCRGIPLSRPELRMYGYNTNQLLQIFQMNGVHEIHLRFTKHQVHLGVILFFKKET
jgi:SAM-dependent methyltransferase